MATVLLLPGLMCDAVVWQAVVDRLSPHLPVVVGDLSTQDDLTVMAQDMLTAHAGPLYVAGHSMGGRVAMEMARLAPERVARLALLNTGIHPQRPGEGEKRQVMIDLGYKDMAELARVWLPPMVHPDRHTDAALMAMLTQMVLRMTPDLHARQMRALLNRPDASQTIGAYTGPLTLVVGRQDAWSPVSQHEDIARLAPHAKLHIVEDAGHFAPVEQPDAVSDVLADWALAEDAPVTDRIPDTPLFDRARSNSGYALNKAAMGLSTPEGRAAFKADEDAYLDRFGMTPEQKAAVMARDWAEMVRLGGNLFYILKISAVDPTPIREIGAAQAGLTLEEFLNTRLGKVTNG